MARKDALLRLHQRLLVKRDALRKKFADELNLSMPGSATFSDLGDAAHEGSTQELNSQLASLESRELFQVERAIALIRDGRYGVCELCEEAIPIARLKALPFTLLCVECQREQEAMGVGYGEFEANWESACEHEVRLSDRELTLGDLDMSE